MKITMIGTGYVGLVTGACFAEVGHNVTCVDLDEDKIVKLRQGILPIYEPGLEAIIHRNLAHERLDFTTEISHSLLEASSMVFIAVGTPESGDGSADLGQVKAAAHLVGKLAPSDLVVVIKSTVPVGTGDLVERVIKDELSKRNVRHNIVVASNPEFLKEGNAVHDFMKPDRIVIGIDDVNLTSKFRELYQPFIIDDHSRLLVMDRRSSEITKYGANAMLATRISFMNELALLCERIGANIDHVRHGIGSDSRIGRKFLYAGPGYGGSCFPKDVSALLKASEGAGVELTVLSAVMKANDYQKNHVFEKIRRHFGPLEGRTIAIWGLTFKPGTDDVRESPSRVVIERLLECGAKVQAHDPIGKESFARDFGFRDRLSYLDSAYKCLEQADALVLMTEWDEYKRPNWQKAAQAMRQKTVFDFRNQYDFNELLGLGFNYYCVGRTDSSSTYK